MVHFSSAEWGNDDLYSLPATTSSRRMKQSIRVRWIVSPGGMTGATI
jgi:hypothetical protein